MLKNKKNITVSFRLTGVDLLESRMECPSISFEQIRPFNFVVKAKNYVNKEKKIIIVLVEATITSDKTPDTLAFIKVGCIYDIQNFDSFINEKSGVAKFPTNFQKIIKMVSISTTRGIIYSQFRGTFLHGAILPIVDARGIKTTKLVC